MCRLNMSSHGLSLQSLEWSEFMSFCVEAGMAAGATNIARPSFYFMYDNHFEDTRTRITGIGTMFYHPLTDMIITQEKDSKLIRFYDGRLHFLRALDTSTCVRREFRDINASVPLKFVIIDSMRTIAVLMSNFNIAMWRIGTRTFTYTGIIRRMSLDRSPTEIYFDVVSNLLFVGQKDGSMAAYNPVTRLLVYMVQEHKDVMLSLCSIPHRDGLASSSMDGQVYLWDPDPVRKKVTRAFIGHKTTVTKLMCVASLELLLGLCVDGEVVAWDLTTAEVVMCFGKDHPGKLKDMVLIPLNPPRLATIDSFAVIKVRQHPQRPMLHPFLSPYPLHAMCSCGRSLCPCEIRAHACRQ